MKNKKAISLIVLVITIIVMIILASAIIMSLDNANIFNKAEEAVLVSDAKNLQSELALNLAEKKIEDMSFDMSDIYEQEAEEIQEYIPSFAGKYENKLCIKNGRLAYLASNVSEEEASALDKAGVLRISYITQEEAEELKAKVATLNLTDDISTTDITKYVHDAGEHADKFVLYQGNIYYRYERTAYVEREALYAAELSCFMGDANGDGTLTDEDAEAIELYSGWGEEEYLPNMYYAGNIFVQEEPLDLSVNDTSAIEEVIIGRYKYIEFIDLSVQEPAFMELYGLHYKIWHYYGEGTTSDPQEIKKQIPILTKEEAKKVIIEDGNAYLKQSALSEKEITWCDENWWEYK